MEKSLLDITYRLRHQKQVLTTSDVRDIEGIFVVELRVQKFDSHFLNTQLPLNEDGNDLGKQLSCVNYKNIVKKLHNTVWKKSYPTSADVSMLGYGYGVSMYPRFFVEDLDICQMLPRPYFRFLMVVLEIKY